MVSSVQSAWTLEQLTGPALRVGPETLALADLILLGLLDGSWQKLEADLDAGLRCQAEHPDAVDPSEVAAAATAFRYERALISARDFSAWLGARGLAVADLSASLTRELLRRRLDTLDGALEAPADQARIAPQLRAEACCRGTIGALLTCAGRLLGLWHDPGREHLRAGAEPTDPDRTRADPTGPRRSLARADLARLDHLVARAELHTAAGLPALGHEQLRRHCARLLELEAAWQRFCTEVTGEAAVERLLSRRGLEWTRLSGPIFATPSEGAARELAQLMLDGELDAAGLAARSLVACRPAELLVEEFPVELGARFAAAGPGEPLGPWRQDSDWRVMWLESKARPNGSDPRIRDRARLELIEQAAPQLSAGRVEYLLVA